MLDAGPGDRYGKLPILTGCCPVFDPDQDGTTVGALEACRGHAADEDRACRGGGGG